MPEQTPAVDPQSGVAPKEQAAKPEYVTSETLQKAIEAMQGNLKAMGGRIQKLIDASAPKTSDAPAENPLVEQKSPHAEIERILRVEREKLDMERNRVRSQRIRAELQTALQDNGANPALIPFAVDSLLTRNEKKLRVDENEIGESRVVFTAGEYETKPVTDFVKEWLRSDGKAFLPAIPNPDTNAGYATPRTGARRVSRADVMAGRVRTEDIAKGNVIVGD